MPDDVGECQRHIRIISSGLSEMSIHAIERTALASVWMTADAAGRPGIAPPMPQSVPRQP
jgi:hypothetical protein